MEYFGKSGTITKSIGYKTNIINYTTLIDIVFTWTQMMLEPLLNSQNKERVLIFILARDEGYATEIARFFDTDLYGIQSQLERLESGGILVSMKVGRTRLYTFNPRYAFIDELKSLLEKALSFCPEELRERLLMNRRRPRMRGLP